MILLLANGDPADTLSAITRSIDAGNRLIGTKVTILSFGMDTGVLSYMKFISSYYPPVHHIFNEKLTKRNSVQYEGKISSKQSLCTLLHVFEQHLLSSNEVSGVRLNSQRTVVTARSQFIRVVSSAWQEVVKNMLKIG